jgi:large subunit ribosomal protein L33
MQASARRGSRDNRITITLACTECRSRNYKTSKRREQTIEIKKFCKTCGQHTLHRESK